MSNGIEIELPGHSSVSIAMPPSSINRSQSVPPTLFAPSGARRVPRSMEHFAPEHRNAIERLVELKHQLREVDGEIFWDRLMKGITSICNAQCAFVAEKSALNGTDRSVVTLDISITQNGLLFPQGIAVYYKDRSVEEALSHHSESLKNIARSFLATDKVNLIPEKLGSIVETVNDELCPMDAYLAVPLFSAGKCFAHFGLMWTVDGLAMRNVPWMYLEMILLSLEDLILLQASTERNGRKFSGRHAQRGQLNGGIDEWKPHANSSRPPVAPPSQNPAAAPSFKPYARSLSHELRTPMHGVVGMLDIMYTTVQETIHKGADPSTLSTFEVLRGNIEAVQGVYTHYVLKMTVYVQLTREFLDSARRAIEAADNIVHAYDLGMQFPDTPQSSVDEVPETGGRRWLSRSTDARRNITLIEGIVAVNPPKPNKRTSPVDWDCPSNDRGRSPKKVARCDSPSSRELSPRTAEVKSAVKESDEIFRAPINEVVSEAVESAEMSALQTKPTPVFPPMVLKSTRIRDLLSLVVHESLHTGGRPDYAKVIEATDHGELIELKSISSDGQLLTKLIDWSVDPSVPDTLFFDEKDLAKLISCVFLNALKFTETGKITIRARMSSYIVINIRDTGTGIPEAFLPYIFKPFAREDESTTRSTEGLGLGLMVAKGLSQRLGGDLACVCSTTAGPERGSEFEIRLPKSPNDSVSRPGTPCAGTSASSPTNSLPTPDSSNGTDVESKLSPYFPTCVLKSNDSEIASQTNDVPPPTCRPGAHRRPSVASRSVLSGAAVDRELAQKFPLTFLVAEDNKINRQILVNMLGKLGYKHIYEAFNGKEAVRIVGEVLSGAGWLPGGKIAAKPVETCLDSTRNNPCFNHSPKFIDVILMDLWMPEMDGYQATERIFDMVEDRRRQIPPHPDMALPCRPTVMAVSADVTDEALQRATEVGMEGYMTKPYKLLDLERLITEICWKREDGLLRN